VALLAVACGTSVPSSTDPGAPAPPAPPSADAPVPPAAPAPAPPAPQSCARKDVVRTAPAALFDTFQKDVAALPAAARSARVDKLLADVVAAGGTPLADPASGRVVFLVRGAPSSGPWSVAGSFVAWDTSRAVAMKQVDGTDLWFADTTVPRGAAELYKLLSGTSDTGWLQDPFARNLVWDGIDRGTVGQFNAVVHPEETPAAAGRLVWQGKLHATALGDDRDVYVWLPPRYDDGTCQNLPVVVFHDGNESLTRGDFAGTAQALYAAHPELSAVLVFVALPTQDVRMDQYSFGTPTAKGDAYDDFIVSDLLPAMAKSYRLCNKPAARGVSGASLGGLIATYAAFQKPGVFGWVGAQSASYFWQNDAMIAQAASAAPIPTRFYLDSGEPNGTCAVDDNCAVVDQMQQTLETKGYDVERIKVPNAQHDWPYWKARLPGMLTHFRASQTVCD
jgi:enterochelin esterase family protein